MIQRDTRGEPRVARRRSLAFMTALALALAGARLTYAAGGSAPAMDAAARDSLAARFDADVQVLASDEMEGRGLGTAGIGKAADWIEARLRELQLAPAFGASYRQLFPVKIGVELQPGNVLEGVADGDWTPLGMSNSGTFEGELAFVGYGLHAPTVGYEEFEGVDLHGKVALMLRYEPQERDPASPFDGRRPSRWSALRYKIHQARERGAVAVVFVAGPLQDEGKDKLPALKNDGPESPAGLPVIQVRTSVAQRWLTPADIDLAAFQKGVDRDLRTRSRGTTGVRLRGQVAVKPVTVESANLAGLLPGRGALADDVVVVGAHYDHLGWGGDGSMRPNEHAVHNGADDNASGSVAVLLAAREAPVTRVVYSSSASVYGNSRYLPVNEDDLPNLLSPYAVSKFAGESYCRAFHESYGLPAAVVRYSNVYGPGQSPSNPYCGVIAKFFEAARAGRPVLVHGDGQQTRDFTYIDDAVEATLAAAVHPRAVGEVFNVGTGFETAINGLAEAVRQVSGSAVPIEHVDRRDIDNIRRRVLNIEKIRRTLHWVPQVTLHQGLRRTWEWLNATTRA